MTPAERWLRDCLAGAPDSLLECMAAALPAGERPVPEAFAEAGAALYRQVLHGGGGREGALPLLAADALLTHALEAQAEADPEALGAFARRLAAWPALDALAAECAEHTVPEVPSFDDRMDDAG